MVEYDSADEHNDENEERLHPKSLDSSAVGAVVAEFALVR